MLGLYAQRSEDEAAAQLAASVASYGLGVPQDEILNVRRGRREAAFARQVAMYLCHSGFELSFTRVAVAFARDRSTVSYACHFIEDRREEPQFDLWIGSLEAMLLETPRPRRSPGSERRP